jgi:hypothetical protein
VKRPGPASTTARIATPPLLRSLAAVATLGACSGEASYGLVIDRCGAAFAVERLTISVLGPHGALIVDGPVPATGAPPSLPGRLRIEGGGAETALRILVTGWRDGQRIAFGALRVANVAQANRARLCLETPFPSDIDADGVPDGEDGCSQIPDPDQADADGDGRTDLCALFTDAGPPPPRDGGLTPPDSGPPRPDFSFPDLPGAVDLLPPPPVDVGPVSPCPAGTPCDDGDPCTVGDICDAGGTSCRGSRAPDGHPCAAQPSHRCCAGQCVNIAFDPQHCGGCGLACAPGRQCSGVGSTTDCPIHPEFTSGRCICGYADDTQCPNGQNCRAQDPASNRCSPASDAQCAPGGKKVYVPDCPNYCFY